MRKILIIIILFFVSCGGTRRAERCTVQVVDEPGFKLYAPCNEKFYNFSNEFVLFDNSTLTDAKPQVQINEIIKRWKKNNRSKINKDSIEKIIDYAEVFNVRLYSLKSVSPDTIQLVATNKFSWIGVVSNNILIGDYKCQSFSHPEMYGNFGALYCYDDNNCYVDTKRLTDLKKLFENKIFAIDGYKEANIYVDNYWFTIDSVGRLQKMENPNCEIFF